MFDAPHLSTSIAAAALLVVLVPAAATGQDASPLPGTATIGESHDDGSGPVDAITDVRVGSHDGFDRVTFEYADAGDGEPGWWVVYEDDPLSAGAGLPIEFDGTVGLRVVLPGVPLPPDTLFDTFMDDVPGRPGGIVNEVVNTSIYEGGHTFVVGLDTRVPYRIARLSDPSRVVIDLVHDDTAPVGPVDTGLGGTAGDARSARPWTLAGVLLLIAGLGLAVARRRATA